MDTLSEFWQKKAAGIKKDDVDILEVKNKLIFLWIKICGFLFKILFRLKSRGVENLPTDRNFILASNHTSHLDGISIYNSGIPWLIREKLYGLGASDYFNNWYRKFFAIYLSGSIRSIGYDRRRLVSFKPIAMCIKLLSQGNSLVLSPSGGRNIHGELGEYKAGIGILAIEGNAPVIPAYIDGAYEALPKGRVFPRLRKIRVFFGKPIYMDKYQREEAEKSSSEIYQEVANKVREEMQKLKTKAEESKVR